MSVLVFTWCKIRMPSDVLSRTVTSLLFIFVVVCICSELLQPNFNWRSLTSLMALPAYFLIGYSCGQVLGGQYIRKIVPLLLTVFVVWYAGLVWLGLSGHLTAQKLLSGAALTRLETAGGFTATELPIFVGLQLPMVFMIILGGYGLGHRIAAIGVLLGSALLLVLTASVAAIAAALLVIGIFVILGNPRIRRRAFALAFLAIGTATAFGGAYLFELYFSIVYKLDRLSIGGGRAEIYDYVLQTALENPLIGVGLSNFQYLNSFGPTGKGIYPHNNFLGIAAELGFAASFLYFAFVLAFLFLAIRTIPQMLRSGSRDQAALLTAILGVFVYQQFRGFLQDTWLIKELYFWIGFGLGLVALRTVFVFRGSMPVSTDDTSVRKPRSELR